MVLFDPQTPDDTGDPPPPAGTVSLDPPPPPGTVPETKPPVSTVSAPVSPATPVIDPPPPPGTVPVTDPPPPAGTVPVSAPAALATASPAPLGYTEYGQPIPDMSAPRGPQSPAAGSLQAGIEGVKQIGPAVGLSAAQRQLDAIAKIDAGQQVDPNDDPMGYSAMNPQQRANAKTQLVGTQATNIGTIAQSVQTQQGVATDPGVKAFQEAKGWGETFSALGNAPIAVLQDATLRGLPSLIPTLAATMAGGPAAGVAVGTIGVGPSTFASNLIQTMQQQGVDINDPAQREAWVAKNGDTIKSLYDRAMNVAAATTVAQVGPFEAAHVLPIGGAPARIATGVGLGAGTGAGAPVVESAITGEPVSPQEVITGGTTGAVFGATGGAGGERPEERPTARPPRSVEEQRLPPAAETPPVAPAVPPVSEAPRPGEVPVAPPVVAAPAPGEAPKVAEPPPPPGTVPVGVVEAPKPPEAPAPAETPAVPPAPEAPTVPVGAPVAAPKVELPKAKVESPTPGSSTPTTAAPEAPEAPEGGEQQGQEQGAPEGDRTAARAPAEQPARPADVGAPDTGRVQPAAEPASTGSEQPPERGAGGSDTGAGRAPGTEPGAVPAEVRPAVGAPEQGTARAPGESEAPAEPRLGDTTQDAGRPAPIVADEVAEYNANKPHPESIGARIDQLEQQGASRTDAENAELQRLYAQRTALDQGSPEYQAKRDELAQVNQQISDAEKAVAKSEVRKGNAIVPSKALIAKRDTLEALRRQRDATQDELSTLGERDSAERVKQLYGQPRPDAPKPVSPDTEPTAFLERGQQEREIPTSRQRAVSEAHENVGASPYRDIYRDAGLNPDAAVQLPIANQARISREQTAKTFGFRDVTSGQKHSDTVAQLGNFYQNAKAYAHVRGIPYEAVGLHGRLALELERKHAKQGYLGVYHPKSRTIGLPGRSNSFAHERMHAVDHYLAERVYNNPKARRLLSETAKLRVGPHVPNTTEEAFAKVIGTLYGKHGTDALENLRLQHQAVSGDAAAAQELVRRETAYARNAREFGDAHGGEDLARYYYRPAEMLARADEAYTAMRVEAAREQRLAQGHEAPFDTRAIAKPDDIYSADGAHAISQAFEKLYPKREDRMHIFEALRQLDDQMTADHILGKGQGARGDLPSGQDMVNPANWKKMANASGKKAGVFAQEIAAWRHPIQAAMERLGFDPTRPKAPHSVATRAADAGRAIAYTPRALMETIINRQPEAARSYLHVLSDHLAPAEGIRTEAEAKGRYIGEVYERDVRENENKNILYYAHAMDAHQLTKMTPAEKTQFFQVMHGYLPADDPSVDPRIAGAASKVRYLLTNELHRAQGAGLDVGHVAEGAYFPIQFDDIRIMRDADRFERQAVPAYGLTFDRDTGNGQNRDAVISHALELPTDAKRIGIAKTQIHDQIRGDARALQKMVDERTDIVKRLADGTSPDVQADQTRLAQLDQQIDTAHRALVPAVRDAWSRQSAEDMKLEATIGGPTDFDTRGPASSFTKGRVFTPEGHELLKDFIIHDPDQAIPAYFHAAAAKIAYAEHFGIKNPKTGKIESNLIDQNIRLAYEHGAIPEDLQMFKNYVETSTGQTKSALPSALENAINVAHAAGSMALMTRSAFASLGEPTAIYATTQNARAMAATLGSQIASIGRIFHETKSQSELRDLAEAMGLITSSRFDSVNAQRLGPDYSNTPSLKKALVWYYRRIGLTALTNNQRENGLIGAHVALRAWAKDLLNPSTSRLAERARYEAAAEFRDLGISDADHKTLAQYAMDKGRLRTKVADLDTEGGRLWARAATRIVNRAIQDPLRVEKPALSQNSVGKLAFGLMSFNYSFYHNVVERTFTRYFDRIRDAEGIEGKVGEMLRGGGHIAAAGLTIYGASLASTVVREALFNQTKWQDMEDQGKLWEWLSDLAIQRTGVNGAFDPIQQAITGLRYEKSISSLMAGAQVGFFLNAIEQVIRAAVQTSPHTNTADYNALKGIYNGILAPAETMALTALPGGPLTGRLLGAIMMGTTGPGMGDWFAKQFVGPKGTKAAEEGAGYGGYGGGYEDKGYGEGYGAGYGDETTPGGGGADTGGGTATAGLGLADDVAVPMMRWMMRLPGPVKALGAVAATAWGASTLAHEFSRFSSPDEQP